MLKKQMQKAISKALLSLAYSDIDECATGTHSCSFDAECHNIKGLHNCQCKSGYSGNGHTFTGNSMEYCMLDLQPNGFLHVNIYIWSAFSRATCYWFCKRSIDDLLIQIPTSVLQEHITAALMLYATIPKGRTTAHVNLDILVMNRYAKVTLAVSFLEYLNAFLIKSVRGHKQI